MMVPAMGVSTGKCCATHDTEYKDCLAHMLEQNYRSTQPILAAANAVISLAEERYTKNLWSARASAEPPRLVTVRDEADQARYVVEKVLENREAGLALKTQAILFRATRQSNKSGHIVGWSATGGTVILRLVVSLPAHPGPGARGGVPEEQPTGRPSGLRRSLFVRRSGLARQPWNARYERPATLALLPESAAIIFLTLAAWPAWHADGLARNGALCRD
jgi:hypothetical protein